MNDHGMNNIENHYSDGYMEPEEEWEREGLLDPAWEKQQKKVRNLSTCVLQVEDNPAGHHRGPAGTDEAPESPAATRLHRPGHSRTPASLPGSGRRTSRNWINLQFSEGIGGLLVSCASSL